MQATSLALEQHARAHPQLLPRVHQRLPALVVEPAQQQALDGTAGRHPMTEHSSGENAGFVDDEKVARNQQIGQIDNASICELRAGAVDHQEPSRLAVVGWRLRDLLRREVEIEV